MADENTCGRWVGNELWWDIGSESISDADLKTWIRNNLPEDSGFRSTDRGIVAYHTRAYATRRAAVGRYMRSQKFGPIPETSEPGLKRWEDMDFDELLSSVKELTADLDYAYRCVTGGYRQGVFDFSKLKDKAFEFTGLEES